MRSWLTRGAGLLLLISITISPALIHAGPPSLHVPPLIRIIGALQDPEEEPGKHYPSLEVSIDGKLWELRIRTVESLTGLEPARSLLRDIGSFLVIKGPQELLARLQSQDKPGQALTIEGRLYIRDRVLLLTTVAPVAAPRGPYQPQLMQLIPNYLYVTTAV